MISVVCNISEYIERLPGQTSCEVTLHTVLSCRRVCHESNPPSIFSVIMAEKWVKCIKINTISYGRKVAGKRS